MNYFWPGSVNTHWGPGPVNTNLGPGPGVRAEGQAKGWGPGNTNTRPRNTQKEPFADLLQNRCS